MWLLLTSPARGLEPMSLLARALQVGLSIAGNLSMNIFWSESRIKYSKTMCKSDYCTSSTLVIDVIDELGDVRDRRSSSPRVTG